MKEFENMLTDGHGKIRKLKNSLMRISKTRQKIVCLKLLRKKVAIALLLQID